MRRITVAEGAAAIEAARVPEPTVAIILFMGALGSLVMRHRNQEVEQVSGGGGGRRR